MSSLSLHIKDSRTIIRTASFIRLNDCLEIIPSFIKNQNCVSGLECNCVVTVMEGKTVVKCHLDNGHAINYKRQPCDVAGAAEYYGTAGGR